MICDIEKTDNVEKWYEEKEFELYGLPTIYYRFPEDKLTWLSEKDGTNPFYVELYDIRYEGMTLEQLIERKINHGRLLYADFDDSTWYCHLIQQVNSTDIGIEICDKKCIPRYFEGSKSRKCDENLRIDMLSVLDKCFNSVKN